jgi:UDP-N-acetyl-D-glucosamine dehydrogenase
MKIELIEKIRNKSSVVGIIGLGYVGLPLLKRFIDEGFTVIGFDNDEAKVTSLNKGISYIKHISNSVIKKAVDHGFIATDEFEKIVEVDVIILCLPTPLNTYREPDLSYVLDSVDLIAPFLRKGQVLSLESTTYPGTTEEELLPRVEKMGFTVGNDFYLIYSPEREDPGNQSFSTKTIPKVVGGHTKNCLEIGALIYNQIIDSVVEVSSTKAAEMTKLLENIHRAVNIGLVNELKVVADKMGINIYEVIDAAATKPFGFVPYYPGPGLGGHCIPIDPFYLTWKAKEFGINTRFIELSGEINSSMPNYVVDKIVLALNENEKSLKGSKILILGLAYKKNIDDPRESPAVEILDKLVKLGAVIEYSDPYIPSFPIMRKYNYDLKSVGLSAKSLSEYDCICVITDHDDFDYDYILDNAKLIIDTRGVYTDVVNNTKVFRA